MFVWHNEAAQIAGSLNDDMSSGQPGDTSFWRTLAANAIHMDGPAPSSFGEEYLKVREYLDVLDMYNYDTVKLATLPEIAELETYVNDSLFVDAWFLAAHHRHFCSTKKEGIGLVPGAALQGDLIAVFLGAHIPFVLRPTDAGAYVLIGECYIHGIVHDEALQEDARIRDIFVQ